MSLTSRPSARPREISSRSNKVNIFRTAGILFPPTTKIKCHDRLIPSLAIRYTATLAAVGAVPSVGSAGDSFDNALAESTIGQIKAELVHRHGPWRSVEQLEYALFEYVDWWNHRRLHGEIGMVTPVEKEAAYAQTRPLIEAASQ